MVGKSERLFDLSGGRQEGGEKMRCYIPDDGWPDMQAR